MACFTPRSGSRIRRPEFNAGARAFASASATIGIYEPLTQVVLSPDARGWTDLRADLSAYAGRKWSLFYRPDRIVWRLVLAADAIDTAPATVLWGEPQIETDTESAREYAARRQRMR